VRSCPWQILEIEIISAGFGGAMIAAAGRNRKRAGPAKCRIPQGDLMRPRLAAPGALWQA